MFPKFDILALLLSVFGVAFVLALLLTPLARSLARRAGLVDRPDGRRKLHGRAIPVAGGPAVLLALIGGVVFGLLRVNPVIPIGSPQDLLGLLIGGVTICAIGILDDCRLLRGRHKVLGQLLAIGVVVCLGVRIEHVHLFGTDLFLGWTFGLAFTAFFLFGAVNSLNLIDGMDGLLSTVGLIICLAMGGMAILTQQPTAAIVALALAGALLGFLRYNFPPASIFLGDSGSMLIGLTIGVLAIKSSLKGPVTVALAAPAALLVVPIFDSAAAILRRKLTGRSMYVTDRGHLHHRMQERGLSARKVLLVVGALGLVSGVLVFIAVYKDQEWLALLSIVMVIGILMATRLFGQAELKLVGQRMNNLVRSFLRGPTATQPQEMEMRLQGNVNWQELFHVIVDNAASLNLRRVRLDVNAPAINEGYQARWEVGHTEGEEPELWHFGLPLSVRGRVIGTLEVSGHRDGSPIAKHMTEVAKLVANFEATAEQMTGEALVPAEKAEAALRTRASAAQTKGERGIDALIRVARSEVLRRACGACKNGTPFGVPQSVPPDVAVKVP